MGFRKSLIFQLLVLLENRDRNGHTQTASVLVTCPLTSIINDQIFEVESMGLSACNLSDNLADLTEVCCLLPRPYHHFRWFDRSDRNPPITATSVTFRPSLRHAGGLWLVDFDPICQ